MNMSNLFFKHSEPLLIVAALILFILWHVLEESLRNQGYKSGHLFSILQKIDADASIGFIVATEFIICLFIIFALLSFCFEVRLVNSWSRFIINSALVYIALSLSFNQYAKWYIKAYFAGKKEWKSFWTETLRKGKIKQNLKSGLPLEQSIKDAENKTRNRNKLLQR